jgi:hypothetical protein
MTAIGFCLIRPLASHDCNGDKGIARWAVFLAECGAGQAACSTTALHRHCTGGTRTGPALVEGAFAGRRTWLLLHASSGSAGIDAVVTALVLAASRLSVSASSHARTDPPAMRHVRASGDEQDATQVGTGSSFGFSAGTDGCQRVSGASARTLPLER